MPDIQQIIEERTNLIRDPNEDPSSPREPLLTLIIRDQDGGDVVVPKEVNIRFYNCKMNSLTAEGNNSLLFGGCQVVQTLEVKKGSLVILQNDTSSQVLKPGTPLKTADGVCQINKLILRGSRLHARGTESKKLQIGYNLGEMEIYDKSEMEWHHINYLGLEAGIGFKIDDSICRFYNCEFNDGGYCHRTKLYFTDCKQIGNFVGIYMYDHSFMQATRTGFLEPVTPTSPIDYPGVHLIGYCQAIFTNCSKAYSDKLIAFLRVVDHSTAQLRDVHLENGASWCLWVSNNSICEYIGKAGNRIYSPGLPDPSLGLDSLVTVDSDSKLMVHSLEDIFADQPGTLNALRIDNSVVEIDNIINKGVWSYFGGGIVGSGGKLVMDNVFRVSGGGYGIKVDGARFNLRNMAKIEGGVFEAIKITDSHFDLENIGRIFSPLTHALKMTNSKFVGRSVSKIEAPANGNACLVDGGLLDLTSFSLISGYLCGVDATGATIRLSSNAPGGEGEVFGINAAATSAVNCNVYISGTKSKGGVIGSKFENCRVTTKGNETFHGWMIAGIKLENCVWDSADDLEFLSESGASESAIWGVSSEARVLRAGLIDGWISGVHWESSKNFFLDGEGAKVTQIVGRNEHGVKVDGGVLILKNFDKSNGGFKGVMAEGCTKVVCDTVVTKIEGFAEEGVYLENCQDVSVRKVTLIQGNFDGVKGKTVLGLTVSETSDQIHSLSKHGVNLDGCTNVLIGSNAQIISDAMNGVQVTGSSKVVIDSNPKIVGFLVGVQGDDSEFIVSNSSDEVNGINDSGFVVTKSKFVGQRVASGKGGFYGLRSDQSTVLMEDYGSLEGFGLDGIKAEGSSISCKSFGIIKGGEKGINQTNGSLSAQTVGLCQGGNDGIRLTGVGSALIEDFDEVMGGATGIGMTGVKSSSLLKCAIVTAPLALSLVGSTVDDADNCIFEGAVAMDASASDIHSKYSLYNGEVLLAEADATLEHGLVLMNLTCVSSRVDTRSFVFTLGVNSILSHLVMSQCLVTLALILIDSSADLVKTTVYLSVDLSASELRGRGCTFNLNLDALASGIELDSCTIVGVVNLTGSSYDARSTQSLDILAVTSSCQVESYVGALVTLITSSFKSAVGTFGAFDLLESSTSLERSTIGALVTSLSSVKADASLIGATTLALSSLSIGGTTIGAVVSADSGFDASGSTVASIVATASSVTLDGTTCGAVQLTGSGGSMTGSKVGAINVTLGGLMLNGCLASAINCTGGLVMFGGATGAVTCTGGSAVAIGTECPAIIGGMFPLSNIAPSIAVVANAEIQFTSLLDHKIFVGGIYSSLAGLSHVQVAGLSMSALAGEGIGLCAGLDVGINSGGLISATAADCSIQAGAIQLNGVVTAPLPVVTPILIPLPPVPCIPPTNLPPT